MGANPSPFVAGGDISPYRFVYLSTAADNTLLQATTGALNAIGVSGGGTLSASSALHASSGLPVTLQPGDYVQIEAGAAVTRGVALQSDANGRAITAVTTATGAGVTVCQGWIAAQSAAALGDKIWCYRAPNNTAYN